MITMHMTFGDNDTIRKQTPEESMILAQTNLILVILHFKHYFTYPLSMKCALPMVTPT